MDLSFKCKGYRYLAIALPVEATDGFEIRGGYKTPERSRAPCLSFYGCAEAVELPEGLWEIKGLLFCDVSGMKLAEIVEQAHIQMAYLSAGGSEQYNSILLIERE
jgi:hypothetical protein